MAKSYTTFVALLFCFLLIASTEIWTCMQRWKWVKLRCARSAARHGRVRASLPATVAASARISKAPHSGRVTGADLDLLAFAISSADLIIDEEFNMLWFNCLFMRVVSLLLCQVWE
nr:defensin-like protein 1 [Ipomoea batatas]